MPPDPRLTFKFANGPAVHGADYDGWALPLDRTGGPPYYSHFVGSPHKPALPKGCVRVKIAVVPDGGVMSIR